MNKRANVRDDGGNISVLTIGLVVLVLMVVGLMAAVTGLEIERNRLQFVADGAALHAASSASEEGVYGTGPAVGARPTGSIQVPTRDAATQRVSTFLDTYPSTFDRIDSVHATDIQVSADGTVSVELTARVYPPLVGWISKTLDMPVTVAVRSEAHAQ